MVNVALLFLGLFLVLYLLTHLFKETAIVFLRIIKYNIVVIVLMVLAMLLVGAEKTLEWLILNITQVEVFVVGMVLVESLLKIEKATTKMAEGGATFSKTTENQTVSPKVNDFLSKADSKKGEPLQRRERAWHKKESPPSTSDTDTTQTENDDSTPDYMKKFKENHEKNMSRKRDEGDAKED